MKVLITGATGLVGKAIVTLCHERNIDVHYLTTSKHKISTESNYKGFYWNPTNNEIDESCFNGVDAIINLAGASISKRWTPDYKKQILDSRTKTAALLLSTIKKRHINIKHMVSASAIGIYPHSFTNYYDETFTDISKSFLGEVVQQWEDAVDAFNSINCKVTKIRIGIVLSADGGALTEIIKPTKLGAGAAFGDGKQWQSWIHITDLAELFLFTLQEELQGTYNGVAPNPVTNKELITQVAKALNRPYFLPNIPKAIMKLTLGEMHMLLFESQRVCSQKIENAGFNFKYTNLQTALMDLVED